MSPQRKFRRIVPAVLAVLLAAGIADAALNLVSLDQEWSMRSDLHSQVASQKRVMRDDYLSYIGNRIADQTPYGNRQWDFFIVEDPAVNAFNLPGGLVYVNSGLIAEADNLEQFAGVLAHEIGHGAARHGTQLMTRSYGYSAIAGLLLGRNAGQGKQMLAQLVGVGVLTNYTRSAENEADKLGVEYAYRAGFDPDGAADFFRQLLDMRQRRPTRVEQFFSSHPLTEERIRNVESAANRYPDGRLIRDSRNFQNFRSRFR
ncbi:MAG TPA: M48 family metalloprotease [Thermoanaerobaculia bacterium]